MKLIEVQKAWMVKCAVEMSSKLIKSAEMLGRNCESLSEWKINEINKCWCVNEKKVTKFLPEMQNP